MINNFFHYGSLNWAVDSKPECIGFESRAKRMLCIVAVHVCDTRKHEHALNNLHLNHTTAIFALSDHYILSRDWRFIVDQVQTNYHGRPMVLESVRCDRAVYYEGSSLWSGVFKVSSNPRSSTFLAVEKAAAFGLALFHS